MITRNEKSKIDQRTAKLVANLQSAFEINDKAAAIDYAQDYLNATDIVATPPSGEALYLMLQAYIVNYNSRHPCSRKVAHALIKQDIYCAQACVIAAESFLEEHDDPASALHWAKHALTLGLAYLSDQDQEEPYDVRAHLIMAEAYKKLGEVAGAQEHAEAVLRKKSHDGSSRARDVLSWVQFQQGNYQQALEIITRTGILPGTEKASDERAALLIQTFSRLGNFQEVINWSFAYLTIKAHRHIHSLCDLQVYTALHAAYLQQQNLPAAQKLDEAFKEAYYINNKSVFFQHELAQPFIARARLSAQP